MGFLQQVAKIDAIDQLGFSNNFFYKLELLKFDQSLSKEQKQEILDEYQNAISYKIQPLLIELKKNNYTHAYNIVSQIPSVLRKQSEYCQNDLTNQGALDTVTHDHFMSLSHKELLSYAYWLVAEKLHEKFIEVFEQKLSKLENTLEVKYLILSKYLIEHNRASDNINMDIANWLELSNNKLHNFIADKECSLSAKLPKDFFGDTSYIFKIADLAAQGVAPSKQLLALALKNKTCSDWNLGEKDAEDISLFLLLFIFINKIDFSIATYSDSLKWADQHKFYIKATESDLRIMAETFIDKHQNLNYTSINLNKIFFNKPGQVGSSFLRILLSIHNPNQIQLDNIICQQLAYLYQISTSPIISPSYMYRFTFLQLLSTLNYLLANQVNSNEQEYLDAISYNFSELLTNAALDIETQNTSRCLQQLTQTAAAFEQHVATYTTLIETANKIGDINLAGELYLSSAELLLSDENHNQHTDQIIQALLKINPNATQYMQGQLLLRQLVFSQLFPNQLYTANSFANNPILAQLFEAISGSLSSVKASIKLAKENILLKEQLATKNKSTPVTTVTKAPMRKALLQRFENQQLSSGIKHPLDNTKGDTEQTVEKKQRLEN